MIPFVLADHSLISAVPFLVPALIIIGFLVFHVVRDRRADDGDDLEDYDDDWAGPTVDGPGTDVTEESSGDAGVQTGDGTRTDR
ncbi:MAG: hypothetical protein Q7T55_12285 [Solirubrobacteraceae bacterium]|nr:hypothetical protein [Solirubrobacteraceae bacterium]